MDALQLLHSDMYYLTRYELSGLKGIIKTKTLPSKQCKTPKSVNHDIKVKVTKS